MNTNQVFFYFHNHHMISFLKKEKHKYLHSSASSSIWHGKHSFRNSSCSTTPTGDLRPSAAPFSSVAALAALHATRHVMNVAAATFLDTVAFNLFTKSRCSQLIGDRIRVQIFPIYRFLSSLSLNIVRYV